MGGLGLNSMGIDLSTSATGVTVLQAVDLQWFCVLEYEIKVKKEKGMARNRAIVTEIMETIHAHKPKRIVLEGYGLNTKHASSIIPLVELGGLLRFMLHLDGLSWLDPRPSELKKFATGRGNSPKDQVMMHVLKRWGHASLTNNTADAFVCAAIGLAHADRPIGATKEMREIAAKLETQCS
jgi:Holliday junction resolvasome RuvABC endonuclease subunit